MKATLGYLDKYRNTCVSKVVVNVKGDFVIGNTYILLQELEECKKTFHVIPTQHDSLLIIHRPSRTVEYTGTDSRAAEAVTKSIHYNTCCSVSPKKRYGLCMFVYTIVRVDNYHLNSIEFAEKTISKHFNNFIKKYLGVKCTPSHLKPKSKVSPVGSGRTFSDKFNQTAWDISEGVEEVATTAA